MSRLALKMCVRVCVMADDPGRMVSQVRRRWFAIVLTPYFQKKKKKKKKVFYLFRLATVEDMKHRFNLGVDIKQV